MKLNELKELKQLCYENDFVSIIDNDTNENYVCTDNFNVIKLEPYLNWNVKKVKSTYSFGMNDLKIYIEKPLEM